MNKPLPRDTCNLSVNILREEHRAIAREAYSRGISVGEFIRQVVIRGLPPNEQGRLHNLRESRSVMLRIKRGGDNARAAAAHRARKRTV